MTTNDIGMLIIVALAMFLGGIVGYNIAQTEWQNKAISHGAARYNSTNAVFEWKDLTITNK